MFIRNINVGLAVVCVVLGTTVTTAETVCYFGQAPDPESNDSYRWVIPIEDPCRCTEVKLGGVNTFTSRLPFKVKYYDTFLQSRNSDEIQAWLNCTCRDPLGMESGAIPDSSLSVSDVGYAGFSAEKSRLNVTAAWCPVAEDQNQWIRVDLQSPTTVTGLITQGRHRSNVWVTSYKVQHSDDGTNWSDVTGTDGLPVKFQGNVDNETPVTNYFPAVLNTRFIQIRPLAWTRYICLRFELLGCRPCRDPLGMESGIIPGSSLSASYENNSPGKFRLNAHEAWCAFVYDEDLWIRVDLGAVTTVTGLITQGDIQKYEWLFTPFRVQYSNDETNWSDVIGANGLAIQFQGNVDGVTPVTSYFPAAVNTRFIQIRPLESYISVCLRFELLGCRAA
ncbi:neuropilin-1-like isoform X2 [Patiria miniata]|uniref:F5/8 type C domain-containing protein n=1 Tax=Patiria miniata TaxID=46514 RepID=A0A914ALK7_PATMI|nr:neuropilin-1-like isoform X2 [Patiria miniata]